MVAYTKPQQRKKEESEQLRGYRDKIKFIDLRLDYACMAMYGYAWLCVHVWLCMYVCIYKIYIHVYQ